MSHHINDKGQFQSDKYPDLQPDKIVLSFKDKAARRALWEFTKWTTDKELAEDIRKRCMDFNSVFGRTTCGNPRHPDGAWHEATPYPAGHNIIGWTLYEIRYRRNGCGCRVKKEQN